MISVSRRHRHDEQRRQRQQEQEQEQEDDSHSRVDPRAAQDQSVCVVTSLRRVAELLEIPERDAATSARRACGVLLGLVEADEGFLPRQAPAAMHESTDDRQFRRRVHAAALQIARTCSEEPRGERRRGLPVQVCRSSRKGGTADAVRLVEAVDELLQRDAVGLYGYQAPSTSGETLRAPVRGKRACAEGLPSTVPVRLSRHREVVSLLMSLSPVLQPDRRRRPRSPDRVGCIEEGFDGAVDGEGMGALSRMQASLRPGRGESVSGAVVVAVDDFETSMALPFAYETSCAVMDRSSRLADFMRFPAQGPVPAPARAGAGVDDRTPRTEPADDAPADDPGISSAWAAFEVDVQGGGRRPRDAYFWSGKDGVFSWRAGRRGRQTEYLLEGSAADWPETFVRQMLFLLRGPTTTVDGAALSTALSAHKLTASQQMLLSDIRETMRIRRELEENVAACVRGSRGHVAQGLAFAVQSILRSHDLSMEEMLRSAGCTEGARGGPRRGPSPLRLYAEFKTLRRQLNVLREIPFESRSAAHDHSTSILDFLYDTLCYSVDDTTCAIVRFLFRAACRPFLRNVFQWIFEGNVSDASMEFALTEWPLKDCEGHDGPGGYELVHNPRPAGPKFFAGCMHELFWCGKQVRILRGIAETKEEITRVAERSMASLESAPRSDPNRRRRFVDGGGSVSERLLARLEEAGSLDSPDAESGGEADRAADVESPFEIRFDADAVAATARFLGALASENESGMEDLVHRIEREHLEEAEHAMNMREERRRRELDEKSQRDRVIVEAMADEIMSSAKKVMTMRKAIVRSRWGRALEFVLGQIRASDGTAPARKATVRSLVYPYARDDDCPGDAGTPLQEPRAADPPLHSFVPAAGGVTESKASELDGDAPMEDPQECVAANRGDDRATWSVVCDPFPAAGKRSDSMPRAAVAHHHLPPAAPRPSPGPQPEAATLAAESRGASATDRAARPQRVAFAPVDPGPPAGAAGGAAGATVDVRKTSSVPVTEVVDACVLSVVRRQYHLTSTSLLSLLHGPAFDIRGHFGCLRKYFCLGVANFGDSLLAEVQSSMQVLIRSAHVGDARGRDAEGRGGGTNALLSRLLDNALKDSFCDGDRYAKGLSLELARAEKVGDDRGSHRGSLDVWNSLRLRYDLEWPMTLVFNRATLSRYARIFQYLMKLRHVNSLLIAAWRDIGLVASSRGLARAGGAGGPPADVESPSGSPSPFKSSFHFVSDRELNRRLWKVQVLRTEAAQFVSVLQQHASNELLDDDRLCESLRGSVNDIGELAAAHQYHVEVASRRGCLLGREQQRVRSILEEALNALVAVVEFLRLEGVREVCASDSKWATLLEYQAFFLRRLKYLSRVLKALAGHGQLYSLFLKLDFNGYFTSKFELD